MTTIGVFHTPPANQGQIVEVSYASVEGYVIKRWFDRSDGEERYWVSRPLVDDEGDYWNGAPANKRWRRITKVEAEKLLEEA